ncbi:hypothetical protein HUG17_6957 [Dermatophagoides farinae]|uniref:Uncharacterized protein n=1 Tax=Dermatophagoides farinae TaxID=6954 RepID=A0A9D4NR01_DERFA|nr:hypothetical protein HUG17_6957 [Dermatophagoides farinae]
MSTSTTTTDTMNSKSFNQSIRESPRFCQCHEQRWSFRDVRRYILRKQLRNCPDCRQQFRNVTIQDKPITLCQYLFCSGWRGYSLIINSFLQFWLMFYMAFLAFIDFYLSGQKIAMENIFSRSSPTIRWIFIFFTTLFLMSTIYVTIKTILQQSMGFLIRTGYKLIIDVKLVEN